MPPRLSRERAERSKNQKALPVLLPEVRQPPEGFLFFQLTERWDFAIIIKLYMDKEHPFYQQLFHVSRLICDIQIVNLP